MNKVNVGEGYRRLRRGEVLQEGDQYFYGGEWFDTGDAGYMVEVQQTFQRTYRRKLDATPGRVDAKEAR